MGGGLKILLVGIHHDLRQWFAIRLSQYGDFQQTAARRRHMNATRYLSSFDRNWNRLSDPFRNGVGAEDGMNSVGTGGHVADVKCAVRAGLHRLALVKAGEARPLGLQRQPRGGRRLMASLDDDFAFDAAGWLHDQFDVFLARAPRQRVPAREILLWWAQSFSRRLNCKGGRGIGWKIFDAEMAGGIRAGGKAIARNFAGEIIKTPRFAVWRNFADGHGHENPGMGDRLVRFVHHHAGQRRRRSQRQMFFHVADRIKRLAQLFPGRGQSRRIDDTAAVPRQIVDRRHLRRRQLGRSARKFARCNFLVARSEPRADETRTRQAGHSRAH